MSNLPLSGCRLELRRVYLEVMHTYHSHIRCGAFPERTADDAGAPQRGTLAPLLLISSMYKATAISCHSYFRRPRGCNACRVAWRYWRTLSDLQLCFGCNPDLNIWSPPLFLCWGCASAVAQLGVLDERCNSRVAAGARCCRMESLAVLPIALMTARAAVQCGGSAGRIRRAPPWTRSCCLPTPPRPTPGCGRAATGPAPDGARGWAWSRRKWSPQTPSSSRSRARSRRGWTRSDSWRRRLRPRRSLPPPPVRWWLVTAAAGMLGG